MIDFKIRQGLSSVLFPYLEEPNRPHDSLKIEEGCWYLCTDTAELFIGAFDRETNKLVLKRINESKGTNTPATPPDDSTDTSIDSIVGAYINEKGELVVIYSNDEEIVLGKVVGTDGNDGLTTAIKVGEIVYSNVNGIIELPEYAKTSDIPSIAGLASESYVDEKIANVTVDLTGYATEDFVVKKIADAELNDEDVDLSAYYTKAEVDAKGFITEHQDLSHLAEKEHTHDNYADRQHEHEQYLTEHQDLSEYAKKTELFSKDYDDLNNKPVIPSIEGLATETFVINKIAEAELGDKEVDLSGLATKDEIKDLASISYVDEKVAEIEIPEVNLDGYATEDFVTTAINNIELSDTEIYKVDFNTPDYTKAVEAYNNGKVLVLINAAPDINSYALMNYINENYITFTKFLTSRSEAYGAFNTYYLSSNNTWEVSKEVKLNKVEANVVGETTGDLTSIRIGKELYSIPSTDGLASVEYIDEKIAGIEVPSVDGFATKTEVIEAIAAIEHPTVDLTGYATETYVKNAIAEAELNSDKEVDLSGYVTKDDLANSVIDLASKQFVEESIAAVEIPDVSNFITGEELESKGYLTEHQSLEGLATEIYVDEAVKAVDLSEYAKKADIPDVSNFITEIPEDYIKESDLTDFAKRDELPSLEGLATETFVTEAINNIEIPEVDLSNYYNQSETENLIEEAISEIDIPEVDLSGYALETDLNKKADSILFKTDKFVTKAMGGFVVGESLKGISIAEILAKLLELSDSSENPDQGGTDTNPDEPSVPTSVVETIIAKELPMYSVTNDGTLGEIPFKLITLDETNAAQPAEESGFYQIVDASGNVVESGYQELQVTNDSIYYVIALPKSIDYETMVTIKGYNTIKSKWDNVEKIEFISDPAEVASLCADIDLDISHIDTTQYTILLQEDFPTGSKLRFIINE